MHTPSRHIQADHYHSGRDHGPNVIFTFSSFTWPHSEDSGCQSVLHILVVFLAPFPLRAALLLSEFPWPGDSDLPAFSTFSSEHSFRRKILKSWWRSPQSSAMSAYEDEGEEGDKGERGRGGGGESGHNEAKCFLHLSLAPLLNFCLFTSCLAHDGKGLFDI